MSSTKLGSLTLNVEAPVSQDLNKRMLFFQALHHDKTRVMVLNDVYLPDAQKIVGNQAIFSTALKKDMFLSHNILSKKETRDALATAYHSLKPVSNLKLNIMFISVLLLLLDKSAQTENEEVPYTLGRWQNLDDDEIMDEIKSADISQSSKEEKQLLNALISTLKRDSLDSLKKLLKVIWRIHSQFMSNGKFKNPVDWLNNKSLVILPVSEVLKPSYSALLFEFAKSANVDLFIDSELPSSIYMSYLAHFRAKVFISMQSDFKGSDGANLAYLADKIYFTAQAFPYRLFMSWTARASVGDLLGRYSIKDFKKAFEEYQYLGYLNAFLGIKDNKLMLYRIDNGNKLLNTEFSLTPILDHLAQKLLSENKQPSIQKSLLTSEDLKKCLKEFGTQLNAKLQKINVQHPSNSDVDENKILTVIENQYSDLSSKVTDAVESLQSSILDLEEDIKKIDNLYHKDSNNISSDTSLFGMDDDSKVSLEFDQALRKQREMRENVDK